MSRRLATLALVAGMGVLLGACNTDDNIADGTGGTAGSAGAGGSGGSVSPDGGPCDDVCPSAGATQCMGDHLINCEQAYTGCLAWHAGAACPSGQVCSSDGTACITPQNTCASDADCGCGCGCVADECKCTGATPPLCSTDADCGPSCYGLACMAGQCEQRINPDCVAPCPSAGQERCTGSSMETCGDDGLGCLRWTTGLLCPDGQTCNSEGTRCVAPTDTCTANADCGCGCGCVANECKCTGGVPPTCATDVDCGPSCYGLACIAGTCQEQTTPDCVDPCPAAGEKRCVGSSVETCGDDGLGCLRWSTGLTCPDGQSCNSEGTKCVAPSNTCAADADCGCGCGCVANECKCTGAIPPTCAADADCGPACAGFACVAGQCVSM